MNTELLDQIVQRLRSRDPGERQAIVSLVQHATAHLAWSPNPGPQAEAFACAADELFYGGQAGGGKTDLGLGLALTAHKRSLLLRRINKDALKLVERVAQIVGHRDGYNGQLQRWKLGDKLIECAGCEHEDDKHRFKGDPHDLIYFDEGTDFLQSQYRFVIGWNRSADLDPVAVAQRLWHQTRIYGAAAHGNIDTSSGAPAVQQTRDDGIRSPSGPADQ